MQTLARLVESLLAQFVWQVLFSGVIAGVEAVTFWQVVGNTPPLAIALVFLVSLVACLAALRIASRAQSREAEGRAQAQTIARTTDVRQQQARADGAASITQIGGDAIGAQIVIHPEPQKAPFDGVPHLVWSGVSVVPVAQGYEVRVTCANVGQRVAHVMVGTRVTATARQPEVIGFPADAQGRAPSVPGGDEMEDIRFVEFSVPGTIMPVSAGYRPFTLRMLCARSSVIAEREVCWRVIYTDDGVATGFITECSATITSYLGRWAVAEDPPPAMDNTSRAERNESYRRFMESRTGRAGSTGVRRTDWS